MARRWSGRPMRGRCGRGASVGDWTPPEDRDTPTEPAEHAAAGQLTVPWNRVAVSFPVMGEAHMASRHLNPGPSNRLGARVFLLPLLLAATSCGTLSANLVTDPGPSVARLQQTGDVGAEVDRLAGPLVEGGYAKAVAVGVLLPDGTRLHRGYGQLSREEPIEPDGHTSFAIGSLSKGFMAALTASLVAEGVISWDATLRDVLPPGVPLSEDAGGITVRQLTTHTSGLPREPGTLTTLFSFLRYLFTGKNFYDHLDTTNVYDYLAGFKAPRRSESKDPVRYSNLGYGLLGHILELRTGESLEDLLRDRVTAPLGLSDTGFQPAPQRPRARGHAGDQPKFIRRHQEVPDWTFTEMMKGAGGIHSTPDDLLVFAAAHLSPAASPLSPLLAANLEVKIPRPTRSQATGWVVDTVDGEEIAFQIGMIAGFAGYVGLHRASGVAVVVLQNNFNWSDRIGHNLVLRLARALSDTGPPGSNRAVPMTRE